MAETRSFVSELKAITPIRRSKSWPLRRSKKTVNSRQAVRPNPSVKTGCRAPVKEWDAVQRAIAGNSDAHQQLFATQRARLYRVAFAVLRNREDAEDAVQDALFRAYKGLQSFRGGSSFPTWLTRIVINSALMIRRSRSARPETSLDDMLERQQEQLHNRTPSLNPEQICTVTEIKRLMEEQIRLLSPGVRAALQLWLVDGVSAADSSRPLGVSRAALKCRISRARKKVVNSLRPSVQRPAELILPERVSCF